MAGMSIASAMTNCCLFSSINLAFSKKERRGSFFKVCPRQNFPYGHKIASISRFATGSKIADPECTIFHSIENTSSKPGDVPLPKKKLCLSLSLCVCSLFFSTNLEQTRSEILSKFFVFYIYIVENSGQHCIA